MSSKVYDLLLPGCTSGKYCFTDLPLSPAEKKKLEEGHAAQLKKEQDAVAKLKSELASLAKKHTAEIQALTKDRDHFKDQAKGYQEFGHDKERDLLAARDELHIMKGKAQVWLSEFTKIQETMSHKPYLPPFFYLTSFLLQRTSRTRMTSPRQLWPDIG